jgi:fucose permease
MACQVLFWTIPSFHVSAIFVALQGFFLGPLFPAVVVAATKTLPAYLHVSAIGFAAAFGGGGAAVLPFAIRRRVYESYNQSSWLSLPCCCYFGSASPDWIRRQSVKIPRDLKRQQTGGLISTSISLTPCNLSLEKLIEGSCGCV